MKYELDLFRTVASNSLSLSTINKKRSLLPQLSWLCAFARNRHIEDPFSTLTFTLSFVKTLQINLTYHITYKSLEVLIE